MSNKKTFYVTTPIYYPSGNLHIGHAYTTTLADVFNRFKKQNGYDTFFLTGSDEHGQKIEQKSSELNLSPKEYVDSIVKKFKELWIELDINYDKFIRTTDSFHVDAVKKIFSILLNKDLIYLSKYKGKYCISCEEFLTKEQMDENFVHQVCKKTAIDFEEETYMLKIKESKDFLLKLLTEKDFLSPNSRVNEMVNNFIENDLDDLSVTRVSFKWGIPINENKDHIIYVWLDALSNYITALGYASNDTKLLEKFWSYDTEILQLIGKEITRFHSIYWPVILKGLDMRMPTKLLSHGWILSQNEKMSKSLGNVVDPFELIKNFGSDAFRFYLTHDLPTDRDGNFSESLFRKSFNINLANNIGNLISRVSNMIIKYFDGILPKNSDAEEHELFIEGTNTISKFIKEMDNYNASSAIKLALELSNKCNKFIEEQQPWVLFKEDGKKLETVLTILQRNIIVIAYLLKPVFVKTYPIIVEQMGLINEIKSFDDLLNNSLKYKKIQEKLIIFKRLED